jgi:ABC-type dipeptide/oligopeptide/nickel transport system ATPase component
MLEESKFKEYKVFFSDRHNALEYLDGTTIVFSPANTDFDDFKYSCEYEYRIFTAGYEERSSGVVLLGFLEKNKHVDERGVVRCKGMLISSDELPEFFTMAKGMKTYRNIVQGYGLAAGRNILLAMNDLVALKRKSMTSELVKNAERTSVFRLAFMRRNENYFAYNNAHTILDGLEEEEIGVMSTNLALKFKLEGFNRSHELTLNFDPKNILPKRINVLIGRNGLGKSQALNHICRSLLSGSDSFVDTERGRPLINRLLAIASPGETIGTFPRERVHKYIKYRKIVLGSQARSKSSKGLGDSLVQLARSEEHIKGKNRWDIFVEAIKPMADFHSLVIPMDTGISVNNNSTIAVQGKHYAFVWSLRNGGEQALREVWGAIERTKNPVRVIEGVITPLSSGQIAYLKFAVQVCAFIENGTLVLLDEPETHLHPNFISDFIRLLDGLLEATGSQAVMATHSAYFVREVPRSQVHAFKRNENGYVDIVRPRLKTFGADVGSISYFVFDDDITNSLVEKLIEKLPVDKEGINNKINALKEELSSDVIMYLRRRLGVYDEKN